MFNDDLAGRSVTLLSVKMCRTGQLQTMYQFYASSKNRLVLNNLCRAFS